jgi:RimJ/RimL family protein N-acetyltransferase
MISIRRLEAEDLPLRVQWLNTPSVYAQMVVDLPLSLAGTQRWYAGVVSNDRRRDFSFLSSDIEAGGLRGSNLMSHAPDADPVSMPCHTRVVAMGGLMDIDRTHGRAELYIVVDPLLTGHGFGSVAVQWLCDFGFLQLRLSRIYLYTMAHNQGARRLYERLGFVHEGVLRRHTCQNGVLIDRYVHGLLRDEWLGQPWHQSGPITLRYCEAPAR